VWNLCAEQESWWWPGRGNVPANAERMRQLAEARAAEPWLAEGSSSVQQQAIRDFGHAIAAFFDPENPAGKPRFRSKRRARGFVIRDTKARRVNRRWGEVHVPKCGWVRFRWTRGSLASWGWRGSRSTAPTDGTSHFPLRSPRSTASRPAQSSASTGACGARWSPRTDSNTGHRGSATGALFGTWRFSSG